MKDNSHVSLSQGAKRILEAHLSVGPHKPVSYLPIRTVENVLGLTVPTYMSLIEKSGNKAAVFEKSQCCINSGAVYAYSDRDLRNILKANQAALVRHGWPATPGRFIRKISSRWLDFDDPVMPVVKKVFGDA